MIMIIDLLLIIYAITMPIIIIYAIYAYLSLMPYATTPRIMIIILIIIYYYIDALLLLLI